MRLAALLGLTLALPVAAQSQFADSAGTYVTVGGFPVGWGGSGVGLQLGTSVEVGRRFGNGLDAGVTGSFVAYGTRSTSWSVGVTGGVTRPAPLGTVARLRAAAAYEGSAYDYAGLSFDQTGASGDVSATLGRSFPVVGSVRFQPTVGVYGTVGRTLTLDGFDLPVATTRTFTDAGLQVELPVTFRLFGADAAFVPGLRFGLTDATYRHLDGVPGGTFRLNF